MLIIIIIIIIAAVVVPVVVVVQTPRFHGQKSKILQGPEAQNHGKSAVNFVKFYAKKTHYQSSK
jgi:flagellar basal body-associated protein FliL